MSKILFNKTASPITISDTGGVILPAAPGFYTIPSQDWWLWAASSDILTYLNDGPTPSVVVNDGFGDLNPNHGSAYLQHYFRNRPNSIPNIKRLATDPTPDTETSYVLPTNTHFLEVTNSGRYVLRLSYTANETADGGDYLEIFPGFSKAVHDIENATLSLYVRSKVGSSQDYEVHSWQ